MMRVHLDRQARAAVAESVFKFFPLRPLAVRKPEPVQAPDETEFAEFTPDPDFVDQPAEDFTPEPRRRRPRR